MTTTSTSQLGGMSVRHLWMLDPSVTFLNHGSFGACPLPVLIEQRRVRDMLEREPVHFLTREYEKRLDQARSVLGKFVGANDQQLVFVPNPTTAVNTVLSSLKLQTDDEILITNHGYNACNNAVKYYAERSNARVVVANIPLPTSEQAVIDTMMQSVSNRTRFVLIDHVTSPTGLVFPVEELTKQLTQQGIEVMIDGAHAPGMLPLNINELNPTYYTGALHKWVCAPKGASFLWISADKVTSLRPLVIGHGANDARSTRSRLHKEFDWAGTFDPTAYLSVEAAIYFMSDLFPGGYQSIIQHNHQLVCQARERLLAVTNSQPIAPTSMLGSLAAITLPDRTKPHDLSSVFSDELQEQLIQQRIEVPVYAWPTHPKRLLRVSAQIYNCMDDYEKLASALERLLQRL